MASMQDIVAKARSLGEDLAANERVRAHYAARRATHADKAAQDLLRDYAQAVQRIQALEAEGKPVEVSDKQRIQEAELKMASNDALKQLMRTQADYVELMNQVNAAMEEPLRKLEEGPA